MSIRMRYDQEDDVFMIWFASDKSVDYAEQVGQSILHLTERGEPVLLEILNAREFVTEIVRVAMSPETSPA